MTRHLVSGVRRNGNGDFDGAASTLRSRTCRDRAIGENSCALLMPRMLAVPHHPCQYSEFLN